MHNDSIASNIYSRVKNGSHDEVYIVSDFLDLGEYHAVRKALLRLDEAGKIQKVMRGVYYCPRYSELIDEFEAPSPDKVAEALARKFSWKILPSGDIALNQLGLSTQVPAKWSYISDGPYREFQIKNITIEFKHRNNREISGLSRQTAIIIQALKAIGKEKVTETHLNVINRLMSYEEKICAVKEAKQAPVWVYSKIKQICEIDEEEKYV